jgi:hypothetical protein
MNERRIFFPKQTHDASHANHVNHAGRIIAAATNEVSQTHDVLNSFCVDFAEYATKRIRIRVDV